MAPPTETAAWVLNSQNGPESLEKKQLPIPALKDDEVLVKLHGASLNYRELMIAKGGFGLQLAHKDLVPGSDGAGIVESTGSKVKESRKGDKVVAHLMYRLGENQAPMLSDASEGLGQSVDGTLRQYGAFHESTLVPMPKNLDFVEASTLTCSGLTAWNALFGLESKAPKEGDTVIVQGTGGVSIAALQFALAAGCTVIATTSSDAKADRLRSMGAHHVLNYRKDPNWGSTAKSLTPDNVGADLIVDVGGAATIAQSFAAIRPDGVVACAGVLGDAPDGKVPTVLDALWAACTVRAVVAGTRKMFRDMNAFVERHGVRPLLDEQGFGFGEVKEAYEYMGAGKHFSKVGITLQ